ncbi:MAG: nucleoside-diphosphate kinase [bacterium]
MIKPDGTARGLEEKILEQIRKAGLKIACSKRLKITPVLAADLYYPHLGKSFYDGLIKFITSGEVVVNLVEGERAIARLREVMGATDPGAALPGTIRGDFREDNYRTAEGTIKNLVHGSDSPESAQREAAIFFQACLPAGRED